MRKNLFLQKYKFQKALFNECRTAIKNPGRGWYRIYSFDVRDGYPEEDWKWGLCPEERLVLLIIDLCGYSSSELDESALEGIREAFNFFKANDKELIVRFVYDRKGEALLSEPVSLKMILAHMSAVAPVVNEFKTDIFCLQGLFVGSWGEMHSSRFSDNDTLKALWKHWSELISDDIFIAVRTPKQWRAINTEQSKRLGLFNDGMLGSETDLGTYAIDAISKEIDFQDRLCKSVPNGGEVVGLSKEAEIKNAVKRMKKTHVSYLNSVYDEQVLNRWKASKYKGINAYEYVSMHLGYRFVIKDVAYIHDKNKKASFFRISIENKGFSNIYEQTRVWLELIDVKGTKLKVASGCDLRECEAQKITSLLISVDDIQLAAIDNVSKVYLCAARIKDDNNIYFSNDPVEKRVFLGSLQYIKNGEK